MSQLKRYNGTSWENVGGSVIPALDSTVSTTSTNGVENQAITNHVKDAISGDLTVNSIKTKNMFDSKTLIQGDITNGFPNIRISSRQALWLEVGTYTFSTNMSSSYNFVALVQNVGVPPLTSQPTFIYDSGWQTGTTKTFTISTAGWFMIYLRRSDNGNFTTTDLTNLYGYNYQVEKGSTATAFTSYQNLQPNISDTGWVPLTLTSTFTNYGADTNNTPRYRRIGNIVHIKGMITPTAQISANQSTTISTVPVDIRPIYTNIVTVCQGSGINRWSCNIETNGRMLIERYGSDSNIAIPAGTWLPFSITYFVG